MKSMALCLQKYISNHTPCGFCLSLALQGYAVAVGLWGRATRGWWTTSSQKTQRWERPSPSIHSQPGPLQSLFTTLISLSKGLFTVAVIFLANADVPKPLKRKCTQSANYSGRWPRIGTESLAVFAQLETTQCYVIFRETVHLKAEMYEMCL